MKNLMKRKRIKKYLKKFYTEDGQKKETSIEKKVRKYLENSGIPFEPEKFIKHKNKWKCYDFFVSDGVNYTFLIECDGWFHGWDKNGEEIPDSKLCKIQRKNKRNDRVKDNIAKELGIPLIRLKENDIKWNFKKITHKIRNEIKKQKGQ